MCAQIRADARVAPYNGLVGPTYREAGRYHSMCGAVIKRQFWQARIPRRTRDCPTLKTLFNLPPAIIKVFAGGCGNRVFTKTGFPHSFPALKAGSPTFRLFIRWFPESDKTDQFLPRCYSNVLTHGPGPHESHAAPYREGCSSSEPQ